MECGTFTGRAFYRDGAVMILHHFFANRQANAGAFEIRATMEPLKNLEDFGMVLFFKPNTLVGKRNFNV